MSVYFTEIFIFSKVNAQIDYDKTYKT